MSYLSIQNLTKSYHDQVVLKDISLTIEKGTFVTFLGPSGCGKSTLLRSIAGLEKFEKGEVFLDGECINQVKPKDRNIGMIFQQYGLFPTKTVYDNVAFGLTLRKKSKDEILQQVELLLNLVGLQGFSHKYPAQLSGGQQQRVALARSLITEPKVILFDEPLSAIDAKLRKELQIKIKEIHQTLGMTSIFVTHDQEEAMCLSDTIYLMNQGEIEQAGSPESLYHHPQSRFVAEFIGDHNVLTPKAYERIFNRTTTESYVVINPKNIVLHTEKSTQSLQATILDVMFLGDFIRVLIDANGVSLKCNVYDNNLCALIKGQPINFSLSSMVK